MSDQQQHLNAATALIEYRLRLVGDKLPEGRKNPNLQINVTKKNEIQINCNTGLFGADAQQVQIGAKIAAFDFGMLVIYGEQIHQKEPGFQFPLIRCYGPRKKKGPQDTGRGLDAVILVGKDAQGGCYISVMRKDPPHIKFFFRPGTWSELVDSKTNQPVDIATLTNYYSQAWAKTLAPLVSYALSTKVYDFREDPATQQNSNYSGGQGGGQNGGGGYQNRNNGGGQQGGGYPQNQQQAPAPAPASDDGWGADIPM